MLHLLCLAVIAPQQRTRADVEALLRRAQTTHMISDTDLAPYRAIGKRSLELFAPYLGDKDLGAMADLAMEEIDSVETTRYMLRALPRLDPDTQRRMLQAANRAMQEYDLYVRAGSPKAKPGQPPPRFPTNQVAYPFKEEVHQVALRMLEDPNPGQQVLVAIGLSGSRSDIQALRKFVPNTDGMHIGDNRTYALASMARLGDKWAIDRISAELAKPVPTVPAAVFNDDSGHPHAPKPGAIVVPEPAGQHLRAVMFAAGFSMNKRLVPTSLSTCKTRRDNSTATIPTPTQPKKQPTP